MTDIVERGWAWHRDRYEIDSVTGAGQHPNTQLLADLLDEITRLRAGLRNALDMVVDTQRDGGYSVSEFRRISALLKEHGK